MRFDSETINHRKLLWIALSYLFLDTELQEYNFKSIAKTMKKSGYSLEEINQILLLEVFPVCIPNLYSVAGEWVGFDENFIVDAISSAKAPSLFKQWIHRRSFSMIKDEWEEVQKHFKVL